MRLLLGKTYGLTRFQGVKFIVVVCSVSCYIDGLDLLKSYIHILLMVSGVFVLCYI